MCGHLPAAPRAPDLQVAISGAETVHRLRDDLAAHDCQRPGGRQAQAPGGQLAQHEGAEVQLCLGWGACTKEAGAVGVGCSHRGTWLVCVSEVFQGTRRDGDY